MLANFSLMQNLLQVFQFNHYKKIKNILHISTLLGVQLNKKKMGNISDLTSFIRIYVYVVVFYMFTL